MLGAEEDRAEIYIEHLVPVILGRLFDLEAGAADPRIVDQHVQPLKPGDRALDDALAIGDEAEISRCGNGPVAGAELGQGLGDGGFAAAVHGNAGAGAQERFDRGAPNAARAPGDEDFLALEVHGSPPALDHPHPFDGVGKSYWGSVTSRAREARPAHAERTLIRPAPPS